MTTTPYSHESSDTCLTVEAVSLSFGAVSALSSVSLSVPHGSIVGIIGPNGAGKTSLLNCINGVYKPDSGRVIYEGEDISSEPPHRRARRGIARTFQNLELIGDATVLDNIALGRHIHIRSGVIASCFYVGRARRQEERSREAVERVTEFLNLGELRNQVAGSLPAGMRKLVEVGRALAMDPKLLLLDEPSGGMNHEERRAVAGYIIRMKKEMGLTQILIEHDLRFVRELCDYIYVLNFGLVLGEGVPEKVLNEPAVLEAYAGG